ncbi:excisionase family DNA-binding protein [Kribbella sp. NPDC056951]|uniref:excisionase family DNA-binding protein n=1 Tax=Kribbella sp. NPDC056951 TaxID=3345978 RepID=UPI003627F28F
MSTTPTKRVTTPRRTTLPTSTTDSDRLLDVEEAAIMLGTFNTSGVRFPRRLIAERRIRFVRIGRLVRIPESAIRELIDANTVQPMRVGFERKAA